MTEIFRLKTTILRKIIQDTHLKPTKAFETSLDYAV